MNLTIWAMVVRQLGLRSWVDLCTNLSIWNTWPGWPDAPDIQVRVIGLRVVGAWVCGSWAWACGQALRLNLSIWPAITDGARGAKLETCKYMTRKDCGPLWMQLSRGPDGRKMKLL